MKAGPLLACLAVLVAGHAYSSEYILPCTGTGPALATPTPAKPPGMPAQVKPAAGAPPICGPYIVGYAPTGVVGGYWCQSSPDAQPRPVMGAVRWSFFTPEMAADLAAIPLAGDSAEAARLFQVKHQTTHFYNLCDVWGHPSTDWRARFNAAMPVVRPPPTTTWQTPATGTGTIYLTAGTRLGVVVSGKKAPPATACACPAAPITYFGGTFCPLAAGPANEVTLCRQVTQ